MEAAIAIIISGLLLSPLIFVFVAFRIIFPRHAVKIKDAFLVPVGILVVVVFDSPQIYIFSKWLPKNVADLHGVWLWLRSLPSDNFGLFFNSIFYVLSLCLIPFLLTLFFAWIANFCYGWFYKTQPSETSHPKWLKNLGWSLIFFWGPFFLIGRAFAALVKNQILNHFGQSTYFDSKNEQLMIDVMSKDNYLYSGIYSDFFIDDGKFVGVTLINILRYKYNYNKDGKKLPNRADNFLSKIFKWKVVAGFIEF